MSRAVRKSAATAANEYTKKKKNRRRNNRGVKNGFLSFLGGRQRRRLYIVCVRMPPLGSLRILVHLSNNDLLRVTFLFLFHFHSTLYFKAKPVSIHPTGSSECIVYPGECVAHSFTIHISVASHRHCFFLSAGFLYFLFGPNESDTVNAIKTRCRVY